jgi:hypothetical protein
MTGNFAPRNLTWHAMQTSNTHAPAGGICRGGDYAEYIGMRQTTAPAISAGDGMLEKLPPMR